MDRKKAIDWFRTYGVHTRYCKTNFIASAKGNTFYKECDCGRDQALAALESEPVCKICNDTGFKPPYRFGGIAIPCDCQKAEKCKTCGGSGTVVNPTWGPDDPSQPPYLDCRDCQKPAVSPSEYKAELKAVVIHIIKEYEGIIDRQAATIKSQAARLHLHEGYEGGISAECGHPMQCLYAAAEVDGGPVCCFVCDRDNTIKHYAAEIKKLKKCKVESRPNPVE